jgi:hypothetical protein
MVIKLEVHRRQPLFVSDDGPSISTYTTAMNCCREWAGPAHGCRGGGAILAGTLNAEEVMHTTGERGGTGLAPYVFKSFCAARATVSAALPSSARRTTLGNIDSSQLKGMWVHLEQKRQAM